MLWVIYLSGILKSQLPQQLIWSVEMPATPRSFNYRGLLGPGLLWMAQYILCFLLYRGTKSICVNYRRSGTNPEVQPYKPDFGRLDHVKRRPNLSDTSDIPNYSEKSVRTGGRDFFDHTSL
jgi:hypothetical protein